MKTYSDKYKKYKKKNISLYNKFFDKINDISLDSDNYFLEGGKSDEMLFKKECRCFVMYEPNDTLKKAAAKRSKLFLMNNKKPFFHMTFMDFKFNMEIPEIRKFVENKSALRGIKTLIINTFKGIPLLNKHHEYDIMGSYLVKLYELPDNKKQLITEFRKNLYKYILEKSGFLKNAKTLEFVPNRKRGWWVLSYKKNGKIYDVFGTRSTYYGQGRWSPHISVLKFEDLKENNRMLYDYIEKEDTNEGKILKLLTYLHNFYDTKECRKKELPSWKDMNITNNNTVRIATHIGKNSVKYDF
jgi:hypothetical protein